MSLHISQRQVGLLFPAHLRVDQDMRIIRIGPALGRVLPTLQPGDSLLTAFVTSQVGSADDLMRIAAACGAITVRPRDRNFMLAGSVIAEPAGFFIALQFQPSLDVIDNNELRIDDFSPGDPLALGMMLIRLQKGLLDEARQSARELDQERRRSVELTERMRRISSYAAHDFNNLLSILALNVKLQRKHGGLAERQAQYLDVIEETVARASGATRGLLALAHQRDSTRSVHPVDSLLIDDRAFLQSMAGSKVELTFDLATGGAQVDVSRISLSRCLANLMVNAREAMPEGGRITVSSRIVPRPAELGVPEIGSAEAGSNRSEAGQWIAILVSDTGHGMAPEDASRAFELFFSTKQRGSGLGLASVRDFVTEHGGTVSLETAPGEGTTVLLCLPVATAPLTGEPTLDRLRRIDEGPRVLIVEDEPFALDALAELLENDGFQIATATCAEEALRHLSTVPFDILLTDLVMLGLSGIELAQRATTDNPALQVVLMSGFVPDADDIVQGWGFLPKPVDPVRLQQLLCTACEHAGLACCEG